MTDATTLREKVLDLFYPSDFPEQLVAEIAALLEDTGSPAHMRVAAELRGEAG